MIYTHVLNRPGLAVKSPLGLRSSEYEGCIRAVREARALRRGRPEAACMRRGTGQQNANVIPPPEIGVSLVESRLR
jgi:hypothetical protein